MRGLAVFAGCLALVLVAIAVRLDADATAAFERATAERVVDPAAAVISLGEALRANPWPLGGREQASEQLAAFARHLEGDRPEIAQAAWRELRTGWFGTRSLVPSKRSWIERAEAGLVRTGAVAEAGTRPDALPGRAASVLSAVALLGWTGAIVGFLSFGLEPEGRIRRGAATGWLAAAVLAFAVWVTALMLA